MGIGFTEIAIILAIVLLLFGGKKIPELMKGLGKGMREFKNAKEDNVDASADNVSGNPVRSPVKDAAT